MLFKCRQAGSEVRGKDLAVEREEGATKELQVLASTQE